MNELISLEFVPYSVLPTHCSANFASNIDHIFANFGVVDNKRDIIKSLTITADVSDHYANIIIVTSKKKNADYSERPFIRIYSTTNITNFQCMLAFTD